MNGAQREIKGMCLQGNINCFHTSGFDVLDQSSILVKSRNMEKGGGGDIKIHQKMEWKRNSEKKTVSLGEIEKRGGHYSIMKDSDEVM